jgi:hypothetical protein
VAIGQTPPGLPFFVFGGRKNGASGALFFADQITLPDVRKFNALRAGRRIWYSQNSWIAEFTAMGGSGPERARPRFRLLLQQKLV